MDSNLKPVGHFLQVLTLWKYNDMYGGKIFTGFTDGISQKLQKKIVMFSSPWYNLFHIFLVVSHEHFVYG